MLGAISGDIIGSIYEKNNIKTKKFELFGKNNKFTDDSVMTCAIAAASIIYLNNKNTDKFKENCIKYMQEYGRNHINAGYGGSFIHWIISKNPQPYNSFGNGSAMRVSPVAYVADTLEEAEVLAKLSAEVSHNHIEGIKGAQAIAGSIWLLLHNASKEEVKKYIETKYYELNFKLDDIRKQYSFDVTCQGSVPQSIESFLESKNFEDTIRNAVSLGGDSDTISAIAGSLAEAYYGIPDKLKHKVISYLDKDLYDTVSCFYDEIKYSKRTNIR